MSDVTRFGTMPRIVENDTTAPNADRTNTDVRVVHTHTPSKAGTTPPRRKSRRWKRRAIHEERERQAYIQRKEDEQRNAERAERRRWMEEMEEGMTGAFVADSREFYGVTSHPEEEIPEEPTECFTWIGESPVPEQSEAPGGEAVHTPHPYRKSMFPPRRSKTKRVEIPERQRV